MMELISVASGLLNEKSLGMLTELVSAATDPARTGPSDPYRFTFWHGNTSDPRNAVEQVIRYRLSAQLPKSVSSQAAGVEWWLGRLAPPYARNFGPGTHRDMGENPDSHKLESPLLSSVFYLTTVDDGALIVFRGRPKIEPGEYEYIFPQQNTFVMFAGHRWHTIMSREEIPGADRATQATGLRLSIVVNWWPYRLTSNAPPPMELAAGDYNGDIYPELSQGRWDMELV